MAIHASATAKNPMLRPMLPSCFLQTAAVAVRHSGRSVSGGGARRGGSSTTRPPCPIHVPIRGRRSALGGFALPADAACDESAHRQEFHPFMEPTSGGDAEQPVPHATFESMDLSPEVRAAILEDMKYVTPTAVQSACFAPIRDGKDVVV